MILVSADVPTEAATRLSPRQRAQVVVVALAAGALGAAYSLLLPLFIAPDEPAHVDAVSHLVAEGGFLVGGEARMARQTVAAQHELQTTGPLRPGVELRRFLAEDATPRRERPSFDDLGTTQDSRSPNYVAPHGPAYYLATGITTRTAMAVLPEGAWSFDRELLVMRWVNVALLMGTTALTYALGRAMGLGHDGALVAMVLPLGIPQYVHIGSTVNSDNLYVAASTAFVTGLVLLLRRDRDRLRPDRPVRSDAALLAGVAGSLVVLSKSQGLVALPVLAGIALWLLVSRRPSARRALVRLVVPAALLVGPALLARLVTTGAITPRSSEGGPPTVERPVDVAAWFEEYLNLGSRTFWGAFGWLDAAIPWNLAHPMSIAAALAVGVSLVLVWRARGAWILVPWAFGLLAVGITVVASLMTHLDNGNMRAMQGRYSYPLVPLAACTLLLAVRPLVRRVPALAVSLAVLASCAALALHHSGVTQVLRRHWGPPGGGVRASFSALAAWAPTPYALTLLITGAGLGALALLAAVPPFVTLRAGRAGRRLPDGDAGDAGDAGDLGAGEVDAGDDALEATLPHPG